MPLLPVPSSLRSLPVPLKSFDCLAWSLQKHGEAVVQAVVLGAGVTAEILIVTDAPGLRLRLRKPSVVPPLETTFPLLSKRTKQGPFCWLGEAGHSPTDVPMTEIPDGVAGTVRLSEPSLMPEPGLLSFVSVTVN